MTSPFTFRTVDESDYRYGEMEFEFNSGGIVMKFRISRCDSKSAQKLEQIRDYLATEKPLPDGKTRVGCSCIIDVTGYEFSVELNNYGYAENHEHTMEFTMKFDMKIAGQRQSAVSMLDALIRTCVEY